MTDFASLVLKVDSSEVPKGVSELDKLAASGAKAEKATNAAGLEWVKASSAAGKLRMEAVGAAAALERQAANTNTVNGASRQFSVQMSQVAQQVTTGTNALQALAIQLPDIAMGMNAAGTATGAFARFMGGPWGIAITSAISVIVAFSSKMFDAGEEAKIAGDKFETAADQAKKLAGAMNAMKLNDARMRLNDLTSEQFRLEGQIGNYDQRKREGTLDIATRVRTGDARERLQANKWEQVELRNTIDLAAQMNVALDKEDRAVRRVSSAKREAGAHVDRHAESLVRETAAVEAQIAGLYAAADAYEQGAAAGVKAEITARANEKAIRSQADATAYAAQQVRLFVAQQTAGAAKTVADMRAENDARQMVNNQIAQGIMTAEQGQRFLRDEAQLRPLIAAHALAEGDAKARLAERIAALRGEQKRANDETVREQALRMKSQAEDRTREIQGETAIDREFGAKRNAVLGSDLPEFAQRDAMRMLNAEHEKRLILMRAEIEVEKARKDGMVEAIPAILARAQAETEQVDARAKIDSVSDAMERLRSIKDSFSFGSVFGEFGEGVDRMIASLKQLADAQAAYEAVKQNGSAADIERERAKFTDAQTASTLNLIGASKKFFNEQSTGYKVLTAIEKVYAAIKLANMIKAMVIDTTHTTTSVANSMTRATADQAAGASKMFSFLGPFAFPVVAAMIALLAGLGVKGGKGASAPAIPTAEELQKAAGTGSVLGDPTGKSNSIANSLQIVADNTNKDLEYSNSMLIALRSIDHGISKLSGNVARQISVAGGMFDTTGQNLGSNSGGGFLGLFSTTTTRTLWDLGMDIFSSSVADILQNGIGGRTYQIVEQIKKKSGFLGIGGSTKTTYETSYGEIDPSITDAINGVIYSLRQGLIEAAKVVGKDGAAAIIDNFRVEIGRLSFKDMTGDEIEKQLNAVFSKVGDQMAEAILPSLKGMQLVGEGLFETFMRVAREYQVVDISLKSIGLQFGMVGVESLGARDALVQMFESLDAFVSQTDFYRQNFLTEAERMAPVISSVADEMVRLGLASVDTVSEFKSVIDGLDLTTEAGRTAYAALMAVAPAFSNVIKYQDKLAKSYDDQATNLRAYLSDLLGKGSAASLATAGAAFRNTAGQALLGDLDALGALKGVSNTFLDAAKQSAKSPLDYARARAEVLRTVSQAESVATSQAEMQRKQLAVAEQTAATIAGMRTDLTELQAQTAANTASIANNLNNVIQGDTLNVGSNSDTEFTVDVAA